MTAIPTTPPSPTLDPVIIANFQRGTLDALPPRPGASAAEIEEQRAGALSFLAALRPRDLMEATLATRIVATHYAAMECFYRAARDNLPVALHARVVGRAVSLCRLMDVALRELTQRQGGQAALPATQRAAQQAAMRRGRAGGRDCPAVRGAPAVPEGRHESGMSAVAARAPNGASPRRCSGRRCLGPDRQGDAAAAGGCGRGPRGGACGGCRGGAG